jgi:hypothetical protein
MNCGWGLPRAARLAGMMAVLSFGEAYAATPMVEFLAGTYGLTDTEGGGFHSLVITLPPGGLAEFSIDGASEMFSMPDVLAPAGFYNGDSPYFTTDQLFTYTWSSVFWGLRHVLPPERRWRPDDRILYLQHRRQQPHRHLRRARFVPAFRDRGRAGASDLGDACARLRGASVPSAAWRRRGAPAHRIDLRWV